MHCQGARYDKKDSLLLYESIKIFFFGSMELNDLWLHLDVQRPVDLWVFQQAIENDSIFFGGAFIGCCVPFPYECSSCVRASEVQEGGRNLPIRIRELHTTETEFHVQLVKVISYEKEKCLFTSRC